MQPIPLLIILLFCAALFYRTGSGKAITSAGGRATVVKLHSLPVHYGLFTAMSCLLPTLIVFCLWLALEPGILNRMVVTNMPEQIRSLSESQLNLWLNDMKNQMQGFMVAGRSGTEIQAAANHYLELRRLSRILLSITTLAMAATGGWLALCQINPRLRARIHVERVLKGFFILCSTIAIFTTIGIVLSVLFESIHFFKIVPLQEFLFGLKWSPQMAIRADQVGSSGAFGAIPVFLGTLMISFIAMCVAVPIGLLSAIYLSEYANRTVRAIAKPLLEILAGIPTVVYGFFAALVVAPFFRQTGERFGWEVSSESALAAGLVMGIMIIPFISSLADDVIHAVPQAMRDGALGLGATRSETIRRIVIPAALPGIAGGILLAVSRAIGETMIVVMAAGMAANLTANPLKAVTTVTVQIVTLLIGDQEFDSPKTLAAFALGLLLFIVTLIINVFALRIVRKYREQYE